MSIDSTSPTSPAPPRVELPTCDAPVASIVVLGWRNTGILEALESVRLHCADVPYEVIVVLNGADEAVVDLVRHRLTGAVVLESSVNLGFGGGCDLAAGQARGDYLVFLNDDALVQQGWLTALVRAAQSETGAAIVGSRMVFPDGRLQEAGAVLWSNGGTWQVGHASADSDNLWRQRRDVAYCSGAGLLVDRRVFLELRGFDELYFPAYFEDVDLCLRAHSAGLRVLYEPAAILIHVQSQSSHEYYRRFLYTRNLELLKTRWAHVLQVLPTEPTDHSPAAMDAAAPRAEEALLLKLYREPAPHSRPRQSTASTASAAVAGQAPYAAPSGPSATPDHPTQLRSAAPRAAEDPADRSSDVERRSRSEDGPRRVNDTLAKLHQHRLDARVAREYILDLETRLRGSEVETAAAREAARQLSDEVTWLRGRISEHEAHEQVLLGRLDELQSTIDLQVDELEQTKIELDDIVEKQRVLQEQTVYRLATSVTAAVKARPALARGLAPVGRSVAKLVARRSR